MQSFGLQIHAVAKCISGDLLVIDLFFSDTNNNSSVLTNGETTDVNAEAVKHPIIAGAARQIYGSSSLRTSGNGKQSKKRKNHSTTTSTTQQSYIDNFDEEDDDRYSQGVLVHEPHSHAIPPFDPSFRAIGQMRVPGIEDSVYGPRKLGERQGDVDDSWKTWERFDTKSEHGEYGNSNHAVMHPEGDLMQMPNHGGHMIDDETDDDRLDEQPCTLGCLNSEFLCPHSCQCVAKFTRCNGVLDCEFQEDEEDCGGMHINSYLNGK